MAESSVDSCFMLVYSMRSRLYVVWRCIDVQLAAVYDEYSKQCNCIYTVESLWIADSTPFSANNCFSVGKNEESLRFCKKDLADMRCQPAQGLKAPTPHKSDNVTVARRCAL